MRQYRAITDAGGSAELDRYEGMPHVFQANGMGTIEGKAAMETATLFWNRYLVPGSLAK